MKRTISFLMVMALATAAHPQVSETIEVSIVNVDVVVTDRNGNRVRGLTAADFEIRENGKLQPITNFAEYGPAITGAAASIEPAPATAPTASAAPAPAARPPRTMVFFVEVERLPPFETKQAYDAMRKLLRETIEQPGDRAAIMTWRAGVTVRQPLTHDVQQLEAVLAELEKEHAHVQLDRPASDVRREQVESDSVGTAGPPVQILDAAHRQRDEIRRKAEALEAVIHSISAMEGRKALVMVMKRFGLHAGAEYFMGGGVPDDRRLELTTEEFRQKLVRTANANNVPLYAINIGGLRWSGGVDIRDGEQPLMDDASRGSQDEKVLMNEAVALDHVATATGGLAAWGPADVAKLLPRVADDLETYYSLAYRAPATGKDVTRKIEVRTKNRDLVVRARTQFVEKSDETRMRDRIVANLYDRLEGSRIPFEVLFGALEQDGRKRWRLPLKLRIPVAALTMLPRGADEVGEFSVYVAAGGALGATSEVYRRSQPFKIPRRDVEKARSTHFTYDLTLQIDDKSDRVSVGVMDETSQEWGLKRLAIPERIAAQRRAQ